MEERKYLGLMEASRLLKVPFYRIVYAEQTGRIPEPLRIACKRVYTPEQVEIIRSYFSQKEDR